MTCLGALVIVTFIVEATGTVRIIVADQELLELVDAYAKIDGSVESKEKVVMLIDEFCRKNRKPEAKCQRPDTTRARVSAVKRSLRN